MRTNEKVKRSGIRRPDVRSLKIQPKIRDNRWSRTSSSEIKLCGIWLEHLGFHHGKTGYRDNHERTTNYPCRSRVT
jgi:hypothetical protein